MQSNSLYHFLKNNRKKKSRKINIQNLIFLLKTPKIGSHYAIHDLSKDPLYYLEIENKRYNFVEHHIRIDEEYDQNNLSMSHYHYTVTLQDENNTDCTLTLHAYFGRNDQIIQIAACRGDVTTDTKIFMPLPENSVDSVKRQAMNNTVPVLQIVQKAFATTINTLQKEYENSEEKLKQFWNSEGYFTQLDIVIKLVEELQQYYAPGAAGLFNWFCYLKKCLVKPATESNSLRQISDNENILEQTTDFTENEENTKIIAPIVEVKESLQSLIETAHETQNNFIENKNIKNFIKFHAATYNAQGAILEKDSRYTANFQMLGELHELIYQVTREGSNLLARTLLANDFKASEELKGYIEYIADRLFKIALMKENADLMDFILKYTKDFPINTYCVDAGGSSPVLFCYKKCETPGIAACFSILIKYEASVFVSPPDDPYHLPIAHHILKTGRHPLRASLFANVKRRQPKFFSALIAALNTRLADRDLPQNTRKELLKNRNEYQHLFECARNDSANNIIKILTEEAEEQEEIVGWEEKIIDPKARQEIKEVFRDPEVVAKYQEYDEIAFQFHLLASPEEKALINMKAGFLEKKSVFTQRLGHIGFESCKEIMLESVNRDITRISGVLNSITWKDIIKTSAPQSNNYKVAIRELNKINKKNARNL